MVGGRFVAYDHENNHHIIYVEQVRAKTDKYIGPGVEDIGTWQFEYNPESDLRDLTFFGYFKCHPFWITEVKIAQFKAPSRIYDANGLLQENEINRNLLLDDLKI